MLHVPTSTSVLPILITVTRTLHVQILSEASHVAVTLATVAMVLHVPIKTNVQTDPMVVLHTQHVPTQSEVIHVPVNLGIMMLELVNLVYLVIVLISTNAQAILMTATQMLHVPTTGVSFRNWKNILKN